MRPPREWPDRDPLAHRAGTTPDRTAVVDARPDADGPSTDYRTLDDETDALAAGLAAVEDGDDSASGDRIAVLAADPTVVPRTLFAATRTDRSVVPLNLRDGDDRLRSVLDRVDASVLVHDEATADRAADLGTAADPSVQAFGDLRQAGRDADGSAIDRSVDVDAERLVLFTSGTTGRPKGVRLTLRNLLASARGSAFRLGVLPGDRWLCVLPTYHMGGLAPWLRSTLYGTAVVVDEFDPERTPETIATDGVTGVSLVSTTLVRLLDAGWEPCDDLRFVLLGGGPADESLVSRARERDVPVCPTYGMTETASQIATALPDAAETHPGTVGQPLVTTDVSVVDEDGTPVATGDRGELVVDGPTVTRGYLDEARTEAAFSDRGLHTGDLGYRDGDGRLWITGRVDDAFVSGGETVHPSAVAERLGSHPDVATAAVVGLPDREWGHRAGAALVPEGDDLDPATVVADGADLTDYERPRVVAVVDAVPRTASGTVDRAAVAELLADRGHDV